MVTVAEGSEVRSLRFQLEPGGHEIVSELEVAIVAGFTGRDRSAVMAHIAELAEQGVASPPAFPSFYALAPQLVTQGGVLVTTERATSGEAEVALVVHDGTVLVTLASDHTDRAAERIDIALSKRVCHKMVATSVWRLDDVIGHWDTLRLRSWIGDDGLDLYQDGPLAELLAPDVLLDAVPWRRRPGCFLLLCGTVPTIGGLRESTRFKAELYDPKSDARLVLEYRVEVRDFLDPAPQATREDRP
jgi:hypothetical protein